MSASYSAKVTVSSKGWVVIPASLRKKIRLKPGMKVIAEEVEGRIVLTPQPDDPVDTLFGKLAGEDSLTGALLTEKSREKEIEEAKVRSG